MSDVQVGTNSGAASSVDTSATMTPLKAGLVAILCDAFANNTIVVKYGILPAGSPIVYSQGFQVTDWANVLALIPASNPSSPPTQVQLVAQTNQWKVSGVTGSPGAPTTEGNTILFSITASTVLPLGDPSPISITDDAGNSYELIGHIVSGSGTAYLYACFSAASLSSWEVVTSVGSILNNGAGVYAIEVAGLSTDVPSSAPSVINQPLPVPSQSNQGESMTGAGTSGSSLRGIQFPGLGF